VQLLYIVRRGLLLLSSARDINILMTLRHQTNIMHEMSYWKSEFQVERSMVKVTGNENIKIVYAHIFAKSGLIHTKQNPK